MNRNPFHSVSFEGTTHFHDALDAADGFVERAPGEWGHDTRILAKETSVARMTSNDMWKLLQFHSQARAAHVVCC